MPHTAAAMSEGAAPGRQCSTDDAHCGAVKSAPTILTKADSLNSVNSAGTEELRERRWQMAAVAPGLQDQSVSYNSACTAQSEGELTSKLAGIALQSPPEGMYQQLGARSSQAADEQSPACPANINVVPVNLVPVLVPLYNVLGNCHAACGPVLPGAFLRPMPTSACPDLEASMPTDCDARMVPETSSPAHFGPRIATTPPKRKWDWQPKRQTNAGDQDMEATEGPSQKKQQKADTAREEREVTEEEWQERIRKRRDGIKNMKSWEIYYEHLDVPHKTLKFSKRPRTPDPFDRSFKKRPWEAESATWRKKCREIDGVTSLVKMGFEETSSWKAWQTIGEQIEEEEKRRKEEREKKKKKEKKLTMQTTEEPQEDQKVSRDETHRDHKERAVAILCAKIA